MGHTFTVDYPLSVNTYYSVFRGRKLLSKKGREYKATIAKQIKQQLGSKPKKLTGRLKLYIGLSRYDKRDYDIANYEKSLTDCFNDVLFTDDSQLDEVVIKRLPVSASGYAEVIIEQIERKKHVRNNCSNTTHSSSQRKQSIRTRSHRTK